MAVSIKSMAEDLGLSKATISWILSGKGEEKGFSVDTISKVKKYAKKVGYRPNLLARSLSLGNTKSIALIIPAISDAFYSQMAEGVEARVSELGYTMIIGTSEGDKEKECNLIKTFRSQQVAGIIVAPTNKSDSTIKKMFNDKYPFVLIDRYIPELTSNYIIVDDEESSYDIVCHMYRKGCKKPVLITTDTHLINMKKRQDGFIRAHNEFSDGSIPPILEIKRNGYAEDLLKKLESLLKREPGIDGFFFTTHYLAEEAVRYFINHNIDYRNKFILASIHTSKALQILTPEMSSAIIPIKRMGSMAVDILLRNITAPADFTTEEIILKSTRHLV